MSDYSDSDEARRAAARKRLQERQARLNQEEEAANPLSSRIQSIRSDSAQPQSSRSRQAHSSTRRSRNDRTQGTSIADDQIGYEEDVYATSYDEEPAEPERKPRRTRVAREDTADDGGNRPSFNTENVAETLKSIGLFIVHYARIVGLFIAKVARLVAAKCVLLYHWLVDRFGFRNTNIGLGILAVLLIFLIVLIRSCATPVDPGEAAVRSAMQAVNSASFKNDDGAKPDEEYLVNLLGHEEAAALLNAASQNEDVYWIASHPDQYEEDGVMVQAKLLKLAAHEPDAVSYVRHWPERYPQESASGDAAPKVESGTAFPRLYQWDERWGYTVYSSTAFALTGCCPTALAMVYQGFSGDTSVTPYDIAMIARNNGYETEFDGTDGSFLVHMAGDLGLVCTELSPAATNLRTTLNAGQALIINVGPGDFTANGHFIVATGLDSNGKVIVNDPYSAERSNQTWDVDTLVSQAKAFYAYSVA